MLCQTPPTDAESAAKVSSLRTRLDELPSQMSLEPAPGTNIILTTGKPGPTREPSHPGEGLKGSAKADLRPQMPTLLCFWRITDDF